LLEQNKSTKEPPVLSPAVFTEEPEAINAVILSFQLVENRCCMRISRGYLKFQFVENRGCLPIKKGRGRFFDYSDDREL
jgi:hypothetical protein